MDRRAPLGLRLIAAAKLIKGTVLACVSLGILEVLHKDLTAEALHVAQLIRISPENRFVAMLLEKVGLIDPSTLKRIGTLSAVYATVLLLEGFGLWIGAAWAEYLIVVSSGLFVPEECLATLHHPTWFRITILLLNTAILIYVARLVWGRYRARKIARREGV